MTALATQNTVPRELRSPRPNGGVRTKRSASTTSMRHIDEPLPAQSEGVPTDADLPLLREIADQLQQIANIDPVTALRQSRQLLEGAFRAIDHGPVQSVAI